MRRVQSDSTVLQIALFLSLWQRCISSSGGSQSQLTLRDVLEFLRIGELSQQTLVTQAKTEFPMITAAPVLPHR